MDAQPIIDALQSLASSGDPKVWIAIAWVIVRIEQFMYRLRAVEARLARLETANGRETNDVSANAA